VDRSDYEQKADEAVRGFLDGGAPLEDSIVSIATRDQLNPEQIKRIVEMANTAAFLEMFKRKSGDDRMVEFETASPESVIKKFYEVGPNSFGTTVVSVSGYPDLSTAGSFFDDVADENSSCGCGMKMDPCSCMSADPIVEVSKEASWKPRVDNINKQKLAIRLDKAKEVIADKLAAAYYEADEISTKLASKFKSIYDRDKLAEFEQDGLSQFGPSAVYGFNAIRSKLHKPLYERMPSSEIVKKASEFHLADSRQPEMVLLGSFLEKVAQIKEYDHAKKAIEVAYEI
jgi:hypothetical protein